MDFVQRKFYIPKDMYEDLMLFAKADQQSITQVLRTFVKEGIENRRKKGTTKSAQALLNLAARAEQAGWANAEAVTDIASKHDSYLVEAYEATKGNN